MANRRLKKPGGGVELRREPVQIDRRGRSRPNAIDYRDEVCFLEDLRIGDAGAGYRRNQVLTIFSQLFDNVTDATLVDFTEPYTVLEAPPLGQELDNCRMKLWSVRFYGSSLIRMGDTGNELFSPIRGGGTGSISATIDQVPTPIKGWIRTDDGIFRCYDILGDRTVEVYGTHIVAGLLAPANSVLVYQLPPDGSEDPKFDGIVDQSTVGVTVHPIVTNSTQSNDECTRCVTVPVGVGAASTVIPIPPGSRYATISTPYTAAALAGFEAYFSWIPPATTVFVGESPSSNMIITGELVALGQSRRLHIPGTPFMRFTNASAGPISVCVTFTKEL